MNRDTTQKINTALAALRAEALNRFTKPFNSRVLRASQPGYVGTFGQPGRGVSFLEGEHEIRLAGKNARALIAKTVPAVLAITSTPEALPMIYHAALDHLADLQDEIERGIRLCLPGTALTFVSEGFEGVRSGLERQIDDHRPSFSEQRNPGGRARKWDWDGALAHVAAMANTPDGLPTDPAPQARIADIMREWFARKTGDCPDDKEIKKRAKAVLDAIKELAQGKTRFPPFPPTV